MMKFKELSNQIINSIIQESDNEQSEQKQQKQQTEKSEKTEKTEKTDYTLTDKANDTNITVTNDKITDNIEKITKQLEADGWTKNQNGSVVNKDFSDLYSAGILFKHTTNESLNFQSFAKYLVCEATENLNFIVKLKNKKTKAQKQFQQNIPADKINSVEDMYQIISALIREKMMQSNDAESETTTNLLNVFFTAWDKLSEDEQNAFIDFYGDKLLTLLQKKEK